MKLTLRKPHITEKSLKDATRSIYTFKVPTDVTKGAIKEMIQSLYGVKVLKVRTTTMKSVSTRSGRSGKYSETQSFKKAFVTLEKGQTIKFFSQE